MRDKYYAITAYKIAVKNREKGTGGIQLSSLTDYKYYHDKKRLITDFIKSIKTRSNDSRRFIELTTQREIKQNYNGFEVICIGLRYGGTNGSAFSVFHNNIESKFSSNDKIVRDYSVFFFISKDKAYMVALRVGVCSCKTAIEREFNNLVDKGNVYISILPITNNEYIKEIYKDCSFSSISYETTYKEDDGDLARGVTRKKETFSSVSISLSNEKAKKSLGLVGKFFDLFTGTVRTDVINQVKKIVNDNVYELDEESLRLEIEVNGTKRSVSLCNLNSLMYDVDISNKIQFDDSNNLDWDSLDDIVCDYMSGIIENDK